MLHDAALDSSLVLVLVPSPFFFFSFFPFPFSHLNSYSSSLFSLVFPPSVLEPPELVCVNPAPFPVLAPVSRPLTTMALADKTKRVVSQFDFSDADANLHVQEFLKQMSKLDLLSQTWRVSASPLAECC